VLWQLPYRQGQYNAATPIVEGDTLIVAGPGSGFTVLKLTKDGDQLKEEEIGKYADSNVLYNTPVLKNGALYGLSTANQLFCVTEALSAAPKTAWTAPIAAPAGVGLMGPAATQSVFAQQPGEGQGRGEGRGRGERRGGGRRGGGGRGQGGYGSVVDAGSVLLALSPAAELVVFQPSAESFKEVARYKVSDDGETFSHPIPSGNRIYVKDKDSVTLWTVE
jgi:hypothetical protein